MTLSQWLRYQSAIDRGASHENALDDAVSFPIGVTLDFDLRSRADIASKTTGIHVSELCRIGLGRVVTEFESLGRIEIIATNGFSLLPVSPDVHRRCLDLAKATKVEVESIASLALSAALDASNQKGSSK